MTVVWGREKFRDRKSQSLTKEAGQTESRRDSEGRPVTVKRGRGVEKATRTVSSGQDRESEEHSS